MDIIESIDINLKNHEQVELCFTNSNNNNINNILKIKNIQNLDNYLCEKLKMKKKEKFIKRDYYYSQIRDYDIKSKDIKVYTKNSLLINEINCNRYKIYIFNTDYTHNDLDTFPNLNLYHFTNNINILSYELNNILIDIENLNVFIKIKKKYDDKLLTEIIKYLQSYL